MTPSTKDKGYKSLADLEASDEYQRLGVLGRERLRIQHFPETQTVSGQQGQQRLVRNEDGSETVVRTDAVGSEPEDVGIEALDEQVAR